MLPKNYRLGTLVANTGMKKPLLAAAPADHPTGTCYIFRSWGSKTLKPSLSLKIRLEGSRKIINRLVYSFTVVFRVLDR